MVDFNDYFTLVDPSITAPADAVCRWYDDAAIANANLAHPFETSGHTAFTGFEIFPSITAPADAVCRWYDRPCSKSMPVVIKNLSFSDLAGVGIPEWHMYLNSPSAWFYLAPSDYHCFHAPISGRVVSCEMLGLDK